MKAEERERVKERKRTRGRGRRERKKVREAGGVQGEVGNDEGDKEGFSGEIRREVQKGVGSS